MKRLICPPPEYDSFNTLLYHRDGTVDAARHIRGGAGPRPIGMTFSVPKSHVVDSTDRRSLKPQRQHILIVRSEQRLRCLQVTIDDRCAVVIWQMIVFNPRLSPISSAKSTRAIAFYTKTEI